MRVLQSGSEPFERWWQRLQKRRASRFAEATRVSRRVLDAVRKEGDEAVAAFVEQYDGVAIAPSELLTTVEAPPAIDAALRDAIELSILRLMAFHQPQTDRGYAITSGRSALRHVVRPLRRAGIYVPGGSAIYLSTLMMCAIPARIAGVGELVVATTPRAAELTELRYVCARLGIETIYRAGGPAGIAALAYGTETLRRVDKIAGPGNRYVTAAKQLLYGEVGIDLTAGPSEIVVLADDAADPAMAAADLLAQAEHGDDSIPLCVTTSQAFARQLVKLLRPPRFRSLATNGAIIVAPSLDAAVALVNRIAPEHLEIFTRDAASIAERVENCGAIYIGEPSGVVFGDYIAGNNHVLPTGGSARFFSPRGVYDFYRRTNVVNLTAEDASELADATALLATFEQLPMHARSASIRRMPVEERALEVIA
jgi:histidinol dehydrogenase